MSTRSQKPWGPALSSASGAATTVVAPEPAGPPTRSAVRLPPGATGPFAVRVNGLPQTEGIDYFLVGRLLVFDRPLVRGGRPSRLRRIVAGCLGIHVGGDDVELAYRVDGQARSAGWLPVDHC